MINRLVGLLDDDWVVDVVVVQLLLCALSCVRSSVRSLHARFE